MFDSNVAEGGARGATGGAISLDGARASLEERVIFRHNVASSTGIELVGGGAISVADTSSSGLAELISDGEPAFFGNRAEGTDPGGGALLLASAQSRVRIAGGIFDSNAVLAIRRYGQGGAVLIHSGELKLEGCRIVRNFVQMRGSDAYGASGGGVSINEEGSLAMVRTLMQSNRAGGIGQKESSAGVSSLSQVSLEQRAMHVECWGKVVLERCVFEGAAIGDSLEPNAGKQFMVGLGKGQLVVDDSSFVGSASEGLLRLFDAAEALVIGSRVTGFHIQDGVESPALTRLGIVNSSFDPPLPTSAGPLLRVVLPPYCGAPVAGVSAMCDPRASCAPRESGGVECRCDGNGLSTKPGYVDDGRACQRASSIVTQLITPEVRITVQKPGISTRLIKLQLIAEGESSWNVSFAAHAILKRRMQDGRFNETGHRDIDWPQGAAFGSSLAWQVDVPMSSVMSLDASKQVYTATQDQSFRLQVNCSSDTADCPADGDQVIVNIVVYSVEMGLTTAVDVVAEVAARPSCNLSHVEVRTPLSTADSILLVEVWLSDVDGLPIAYSTPTLVANFGAAVILLTRGVIGSNVFAAEINPGKLGFEAGSYRLEILLLNGWASAELDVCMLHSQFVDVEESSNKTSVWILVGSLGACTLLILTLVYLVRKFAARLQHILIMVLTEVGQLIFSLSFEAGDLCTDVYTSYLVVFSNGFSQYNGAYRVCYAVFGSLSVVVSFTCVYFRVQHARLFYENISHVHAAPDADTGEEASESDEALIESLEWEQRKIIRVIKSCAVTLLSVAFEDVPMVHPHRLHSSAWLRTAPPSA